MSQYTVLVVIPVYNKVSSLEGAVLSIIKQTYKDIGVVIVDDCSDDGSLLVADALSGRYEQVTVIANEVNKGRATARNIGMNLYESTYVSFLDADDTYENDFVKTTIHVLEKNPELDAIKVGINLPVEVERAQYMAIYNSSAANMLFRRDTINFIGGFPEDDAYKGEFGGEDIALNKLLGPPFMIGALEKKLYNYLPGPDSHFYKFLNRSTVENGQLKVAASKHDQITQSAMRQNIYHRNLKIKEIISHSASIV